MQTEQIDEIREMFRNDDGTCKLSRSDVLRIVDKLAEQEAAQQTLALDACPYCLGKGKEPANGVLVRCRFCAGTGKRG